MRPIVCKRQPANRHCRHGPAGQAGRLQPGCEADFVVLNPQAMPLLARKVGHAASLDELLFAMIVLGDDRIVERTVIAKTTMAPGVRT